MKVDERLWRSPNIGAAQRSLPEVLLVDALELVSQIDHVLRWSRVTS